MIVYRLTLPQYGNDLSGIGASIYGGRWNSIGNFLLYTAQSSSLSILEHLVHIKGTVENPQYLLTIIDIGKSKINELRTDQIDLQDQKSTQKSGDKWLLSNNSAVLKVPSVINPLENNYLINPNHISLSIDIQNQEWFVYDDRLLKKL